MYPIEEARKNTAAPLRTVCPLFLIARLVPVTEDIVFPGALAAFRLRSASNPSPARFQAEGNDVWLLPDKRSHLRKRRRQRTMCEAAGTGPVVPAARAGPTRRRFASARGAQNKKRPRPQERIARCAGQSASTAPLRIPEPSSGEREKRAENRRRFPPSLDLQNSSSIPPRTV